MTGVEGYVESAASGLIAGINMARYLEGKDVLDLDSTTAIGSLANYISNHYHQMDENDKFDPMNVNFGIFAPLDGKVRKHERKQAYVKRAIDSINRLKENL